MLVFKLAVLVHFGFELGVCYPLPSYEEYQKAMGKVNGELPSYTEYLRLMVKARRITLEPENNSSMEPFINQTITIPTLSPIELNSNSTMDGSAGLEHLPSIQIPQFCRENGPSADNFWTNLYCAVFLISWLIFMFALVVYTILRSIGSYRGNFGGRLPPPSYNDIGEPLRTRTLNSFNPPSQPRPTAFIDAYGNRLYSINPEQLNAYPYEIRGLLRVGQDSGSGEDQVDNGRETGVHGGEH